MPARTTNRSKRASPPAPSRAATRQGCKYVLRLYVAGATTRSRAAILRVRQMCTAVLPDLSDLAVIDIYQQPELARARQIVATPTLVVEFPAPMRRFIGNLAGVTALPLAFDLAPGGAASG